MICRKKVNKLFLCQENYKKFNSNLWSYERLIDYFKQFEISNKIKRSRNLEKK